MKHALNLDITFLGIADHIEESGQPFPVGPSDIFQLSQHKIHLIYPASTAGNRWVFVIGRQLIEPEALKKLELRIVNQKGKQIGNLKIKSVTTETGDGNNKKGDGQGTRVLVLQNASSFLLHFKVDLIIEQPGRYSVELRSDGEYKEIGDVYFHYKLTPPLTADQVKAIESDPKSAKSIILMLGCKFCQSKLNVYTALQRQPEIESDGNIWQHDIGDEFKCECSKTQYSLKYIKESLHSLLLKDLSQIIEGLSFVRRYAHAQVVSTINRFNKLLEKEMNEKPFQEYIKRHPIMLARFHAKRLFIKPKIIGKFETDFAILDTQNQLLLIELEKPSMRLFKNDGHPTAKLMHAYGQVRDWLHEYKKHPSAVLDGLNLQSDQVLAVKGVVVAGRSSTKDWKSLQRHLSSPPYSDIEFLTLDDLPKSVLEISRTLA